MNTDEQTVSDTEVVDAASSTEGELALVTGATGYIGGRLVPQLLAAGYRVRCLARSPGKLRDQPWHDQVEIVGGDASSREDVAKASTGAAVGYYLVHSLAGGKEFERRDRDTARAFGRGATHGGLDRIVYLGGLYPEGEKLSAHLDSRREVGEILLDSGVPTVVLRAAVIIGSGSASFEMLRYITERLPIMITPRWVNTNVQPIAIRDVLRYLVRSPEIPVEVNRGFDIGGPDVLTYLEMMQRYAVVAGLPRRRVRPLPVLTPGLSSHWVGVVTPVPSRIARPLVDSLVHEVVVKERDIATYIPDPATGLVGFDRAVELALAKVQSLDVATSWTSAATPGAPSDPLPTDPDWAGGSLYVDERERAVDAPAADLWKVIEGIGGVHGWYSWSLGWNLRGVLDRIFGGPGLRRGRRNPDRLAVGDALDWWRVEEIERPRLLRLRAEMRLPGLAWLELIVDPPEEPGGPPVLRQRALFHPHGLAGHLYWIAIKPFHGIVFGGMQRNIARAGERLAEPGAP